MQVPLGRRLLAESLGSALLLATIIGSGIMGERLSGGNVALALLGNTLPTGAMLFVLILIFAPLSGGHFNPAVSIASGLRREMNWTHIALYVLAQIAGAIVGVLLAHSMFELPLVQISAKLRSGPDQWIAEFVATFGSPLPEYRG